MKRTSFLPFLVIGSFLAAPLAMAQDYGATPTQSPPTTEQQSPPPTDTDTQTTSGDASSMSMSPKKMNWSDLDTDKNGKVSKAEAAASDALSKVFDDADSNKDGSLTGDEYKSYLSAHPGG